MNPIKEVVKRILPKRVLALYRGQERLRFISRRFDSILGELERADQLHATEELRDEAYWASILRLHAHAIDKGLHHGSFKPGRGRRAHADACDALRRCGATEDDDGTLAWARHCIEEYEARQAETPDGLLGKVGTVVPELPFDAHDLQRFMEGRRSCRQFRDTPVSEDVIRAMVAAASFAPSSCNRQAVRLFLSNDPARAAECLGTCHGNSCFSRHVPCFVSFCCDIMPYLHPQEYGVTHIDAALAAMNFALMGHAQGLSMVLLAWAPGRAESEATLRRLLEIPVRYRIVVNAVVGTPEEWAVPPPRRNVEAVYHLAGAPPDHAATCKARDAEASFR